MVLVIFDVTNHLVEVLVKVLRYVNGFVVKYI